MYTVKPHVKPNKHKDLQTGEYEKFESVCN